MMIHKIAKLGILLALGILISCEEPADFYSNKINLLSPPVALSNKTAFIDTRSSSVTLLDSTIGSKGANIRVNIPLSPIRVERRAGNHDQLMILSKGHPGSNNQSQSQAALTLLDGQGNTTIYKLGNNPFDTIVSDPEGHFVVLLRRTITDKLLENMNETVIINLDIAPNAIGAITYRTLEATPVDAFFSENFSIDDTPRKLVCIAATNSIFIFDLENLHRRPTIVYLGKNNQTPITIDQVIFDDQFNRLYVRSLASKDVFSLNLTSREADADRNNFATAIHIIGIGNTPTDMSLFHEDGDSKLFVVAPTKSEGFLIDVATGKTTPIAFPGNIDSAYLFTKKSLENVTQHALVWKTNSTEFFILDFYNVEDMLGKNIRSIGGTYRRAKELLPILDGNRVLLMHNGPGLSIIDLELESILPFASNKSLEDSFLDEMSGRFWIAPPNYNRVAYVDIHQGASDEIILDADVQFAVPVFDSNVLLIVHKSAVGYVTLVDVNDPTRQTSRSVRGFLLGGNL